MNTYGQGPCPYCGIEVGPIILGAETASYDCGGVMFAVDPPVPCVHCGGIITAFYADGIPAEFLKTKQEAVK